MEWKTDNENNDVFIRTTNYLNNVNRNINHLIPVEKQSRWCLLFGRNLMYDFATQEEAMAMLKNSKICLCLVAPLK